MVGERSSDEKVCVVCFMADVIFLGCEYLECIHNNNKEPNPTIIPGISSSQMAASRTLIDFEMAVF